MATIHELVTKHYENSISVSKKMIQTYGTNAAILIGEIISKQKYWHDEGRLYNGRFYWSVRDVMLTTGLKQRAIENAITILIDAGFIEVEAVPQKITLYKVNIEAVNDFLDNTVVKKGRNYYHDTVLPVTQELTVLPVIQGCTTSNTETVPPVIHTKPITKPNKPSTPQKPRQEENKVIKGSVSLYYQLLEQATGVKPLTNWKRDYSILKNVGIHEQDPDVIEAKMRSWFKDSYPAQKGWPLNLFATNYNNVTIKRSDKLRNYTGATDAELYGYHLNDRGEKIYEVVL